MTHSPDTAPQREARGETMSETTRETAEMRAWKCLDCGMEGEATDIPTAQEHHTSIHGCRGLCGWMPSSPQRAAARRETRIKVTDGTTLVLDVLRWTEPAWEFDCPVCVLRPVVRFSPNGDEADQMAYEVAESAALDGFLMSEEDDDGLVDRAYSVETLKRRWAAARRGIEFPVKRYEASRFRVRFYTAEDGLAFDVEEVA